MSSKKVSPKNFSMPPRADVELLTWAKTNRPDMVFYLEELMESIPSMGQKGEALLLLVATSFSAGRWYQKAHSGEDNLLGKNPYEG